MFGKICKKGWMFRCIEGDVCVSIWSLTVGFKPAGSFAGWYRSAFEGWIGGYCCHTLGGKANKEIPKMMMFTGGLRGPFSGSTISF